jgi:hypothetical protein
MPAVVALFLEGEEHKPFRNQVIEIQTTTPLVIEHRLHHPICPGAAPQALAFRARLIWKQAITPPSSVSSPYFQQEPASDRDWVWRRAGWRLHRSACKRWPTSMILALLPVTPTDPITGSAPPSGVTQEVL